MRPDLHVHSNFSNKPSVWAMRKINCPESFTSPEFIYHQAREIGMNYVTITDHNTIDGALEIAHLPGAFLGVEVTTYFPENGCKVHVVVLDITEHQFDTLMYLRKNIYELVEYLRVEDRVHFIAHPLYDMSGKLTPDTVEKIFLLFNTIEAKNGSHAWRLNRLTRNIAQSLTPEMIDKLADKHGITPYGSNPWKKSVVGGSDDHSSFFIARAHTVSRKGETLEEFMDAVRNGETEVDGEDGDVLTLAHSIYGVAYRFYLERIRSNNHRSAPFVNLLLNTYFRSQPEKQSLMKRVRFYIKKNIPEMYTNYDNKSFQEILDKEVKKLLNDREFISRVSGEEKNKKIFSMTSYLANRMIYVYTSKVFRKPLGQGIFEAFRSLSTIGLVHFLISPYYISYYTQHRDRKLLEDVSKRFISKAENKRKEKIALFTDTLDEINGVAITIQQLAAAARQKDIDLTIITCSNSEPIFSECVEYFKSIGDVSLPEYPGLKLHFPPILDILNYIEKEDFTRIHSSTPGTLGIVALLTAKLMDIPITGTYHTDMPNYVGDLTDDVFLEGSAWNFIIWFYNQMDEVTVPSKSTEQQLIERGLMPDKIKPLPRWVCTEAFSPAKRNPNLWKQYQVDGGVKFLYVGRVSKEKNLELLADAFINVVRDGFNAYIIIVGDGPYRCDLENKLADYPAIFTGYKKGHELSTLYASADVFVFPSTTDTFGNVVLEAQASGLPVIVSDEGGPHELMEHDNTGYIVKSNDMSALADALKNFLIDRNSIRVMGNNARQFVEKRAISPDETYSTILHPKSL